MGEHCAGNAGCAAARGGRPRCGQRVATHVRTAPRLEWWRLGSELKLNPPFSTVFTAVEWFFWIRFGPVSRALEPRWRLAPAAKALLRGRRQARACCPPLAG